MTPDVIVVGAGPAGTIAALVLARAGARVRLLDRATFPRHKLCGDTVNPGALRLLRRLGLADPLEHEGWAIDGMIITGPRRGARVVARYGSARGLAIRRRVLDQRLLEQAIAAGVDFDEGARVTAAVVREGPRGTTGVAGIRLRRRDGREATLTAPVTIAADGRRSLVAFGLGLARHPKRPRRYAIGAYFERVLPPAERFGPEQTDASGSDLLFGEMHVRGGYYIGVAPLPGGLTNVCLVIPDSQLVRDRVDPAERLHCALAAEPELRDRFAGAHRVSSPTVLGPLAVQATAPGMPGLVLAGDAAGFIDPMTGDGLHFAIRGGELAASAVLAGGSRDAHTWLGRQRRREFQRRLLFNRSLRGLVTRPCVVGAAAALAGSTPFLDPVLRWAVRYAGAV